MCSLHCLILSISAINGCDGANYSTAILSRRWESCKMGEYKSVQQIKWLCWNICSVTVFSGIRSDVWINYFSRLVGNVTRNLYSLLNVLVRNWNALWLTRPHAPTCINKIQWSTTDVKKALWTIGGRYNKKATTVNHRHSENWLN